MKKYLFLLVALFIVATSISAQKEMNKGYIKFEITDVKSSNEEMAMMLQMMKGTQSHVYFKEGISVSKIDMMGGMMTMTTLTDYNTKQNDMLMDAMGQKYWVVGNLDELQKKTEESDIKITYFDDVTKTILGYKCRKVTMTVPGAEGTLIEGFLTKDIMSKATPMATPGSDKLEGFMLEMSIVSPEMTMIMEAKEIKDSFDDSVFKLETEGYKKMTQEEYLKQMGGMGGLGF